MTIHSVSRRRRPLESSTVERPESFPDYRRSWAVITFKGALDPATVTDLQHEVHQVLQEEGPRLILEVSRLDGLDPAGVSVLADLSRRIRARGGRMALACTQEPVRHVLGQDEAAGLIPVYPSVADAVLGLDRLDQNEADEGPENDLDG
ncbi:STAS domain-containing protein [Nonomuraea sp. MTCD27]|uniref:STAS domain-containing protein n=1 Tax=Nonomuraea sp. MTCD27 TaxID=1676747 RepID=UPI0035C13297